MSSISEYYDKQIAFEERQNTAVSELTADVVALNAKIEELQNTPGRITPADQALLNQLQTMSEALTTKLEALDALTPPTAPANTPLVAARAKATTTQAKTVKTKDQAKAAATGSTAAKQKNADLQRGDFTEERDPKTGKLLQSADPETGKAPAPAWDPDPGNREQGNVLPPIGRDPREGQVIEEIDPKTGKPLPGKSTYVPVRATPSHQESPEEIQAREARQPAQTMRFPKTDNR